MSRYNPYKHWRTAKLENELQATIQLRDSYRQDLQKKGLSRSRRSLLSLGERRHNEDIAQMRSVLQKRRRRGKVALGKMSNTDLKKYREELRSELTVGRSKKNKVVSKELDRVDHVISARETVERLQKYGYPILKLSPDDPQVRRMIARAKLNVALYEGKISRGEWNKRWERIRARARSDPKPRGIKYV